MARYVQDDDRRSLRAALDRTIGPEPAATLMALLPPADYARQADIEALRAEMATKADVHGVQAQLDAAQAELRGLDARIQMEFAMFRADNKEFRADIREHLASMRTDIAAFGKDMAGFGVQIGRILWIVLAAMIGFAGVIVAASKL